MCSGFIFVLSCLFLEMFCWILSANRTPTFIFHLVVCCFRNFKLQCIWFSFSSSIRTCEMIKNWLFFQDFSLQVYFITAQFPTKQKHLPDCDIVISYCFSRQVSVYVSVNIFSKIASLHIKEERRTRNDLLQIVNLTNQIISSIDPP